MRGIIMAGGSGSRLRPLTVTTSKHLLPIYNRPMIDYPLRMLRRAGIQEVLVVTNPEHMDAYRTYLGHTYESLKIQFQVQHEPAGVAEVFTLAGWFIDGHEFALVLGDTFVQPEQWLIDNLTRRDGSALVFAYRAHDVSSFGCVQFDSRGAPVRLEEKPEAGGPGWAIPGVYIFGPEVLAMSKGLRPSARGELEILDVLQRYLQRGLLDVRRLGDDVTWLDVGTFDDLLEAARLAQASCLRASAPSLTGSPRHLSAAR